MKRYYTEEQFNIDMKKLANQINPHNYYGIYGIPRGGLYPAVALSTLLDLPLIKKENIGNSTLIVDDLIDSGATRLNYPNNDFACIHVSDHYLDTGAPLPQDRRLSFVSVKRDWIDYFWEKRAGQVSGEDTVRRMLEFIGENPNRPGLLDTPKRVVKMWDEIFAGYNEEKKPKITVFANDGGDGFKYDTMLTDEGYFFSHCEHHMVPFFGEYAFGYIPDDWLLGASKIARTIDYFSAKLQIAERLVSDVVNHLDSKVQSKGMILVMRARHLCKEMRGVKKFNSPFEATAVTGYFAKNKDDCKSEFIARISK